MGSSITRPVLAMVAGLALSGILSGVHTAAAESRTIGAVEIEEGEGFTRILLRGAEGALYTAFMREDPPRLIVELPEVAVQGDTSPIQVNNGLVKTVVLGAFGDANVANAMARVSIDLDSVADYEVSSEGIFAIELRGDGVQPAREAAAPEAPAAPEEIRVTQTGSSLEQAMESLREEAVVAQPEAKAEAEQAAPQAPAMAKATQVKEGAAKVVPALSKLTAISWKDGAVHIAADGPIDNFDSFALDSPGRIVVDFWGVKNAVPRNRIPLGHAVLTSARIGQHADKVRIVLDLNGAVASHAVEPTEGGVRIRVVETAAPAAPAEVDPPEVVAEVAPELTAAEFEAALDESDVEEAQAEEIQPEAAEVAEEVAPEPGASEMQIVEEEVADAAPAEQAEVAEEEAPEPPAAPQAAAAPQPIAGSGRVQSVHFESLPQVDRVVVNLDGARETKIVEPDDHTLIVMLPNTTVDADTERRVDTREFGGPIQMFSIFKTPDIVQDEVRVVLKRAWPVKASLRWIDTSLYVEVERPDEGAAPEMSASVPPAAPQAGAPAPPVPAPAAVPAAATSEPAAPAAPAASDPWGDDPFLDGPSDPAAIDILEEGGFDEDKQYQGRRISLDFKDADIGNILRLIAEVSDLNVIAGEEVKGKVTIRLVDVPWDQALDVILLTKGLGFVRIGNILRIAPIETLKLERQARLQERRAREKLEDLVVKLQPVNFAKARAVAKLVKKLLTARGSVNVDTRTNTLIIKDIPTVVHEATQLVKALDTQTPQVMIEAKIVEASLDFRRALGSVWGAQYNSNGQRGGAKDLRFTDTDNSTVAPLITTDVINNFLAANPISSPTGVLNLSMLALDDHLQLDVQLQASESSGKAKVISSPRVVTMDNKQASIKQGVAIAFESSDGDQVTTQFVDAVLELKVTPHITANKSIIMKIKVSRNAPALDTEGDAIGIDKNETTTETIVRDGETMVLGGIFVVDNGRTRSKVPFLADIPIIGAAFRSFTVNDERRELLIFVTPSVVQSQETGEL